MNVIKCWVPAYPGHHPYQYLSQLGCGGGCSELQLVRINITLLPLMELQKFPAAVTSLQCFTVLKRSFDFKTFYSGRRNPAAMGRLPLQSARQQAGFPLTWKFKVWHWCFLYMGQSNTFPVVCLCQDSIQSKSSDFASFLPLLHYFLYDFSFSSQKKSAIASHRSFWEGF